MTIPLSAVTAIGPSAPLPSTAGGNALPRPGELLHLLLMRQEPGGAWLASGPNGLRLLLPSGLGQAGDTVSMRVLQGQQLQLQPRPSAEAASSPTADEGSSAAMRTDQAWLQQRFHSARASQVLPATMAAQWRSQVLAEVLRPGRPGPAEMPVLAGPAERASATESMSMPLLGWNGQALLLRLLTPQAPVWPLPEREAEQPPEPAPEQQSAADEPGEGLRLGLILSLNGDWVHVLLQWQQGLLIHFSAEQAGTLQTLRALLPRIAGALAAVPLPLRHCLLSAKPPAMPPMPQGQQSRGVAHSSSSALFRAAAEIASVLQQGA